MLSIYYEKTCSNQIKYLSSMILSSDRFLNTFRPYKAMLKFKDRIKIDVIVNMAMIGLKEVTSVI